MRQLILTTYLRGALQVAIEQLLESSKSLAQISDLGFQTFNVSSGLPRPVVKGLHPSLHFLVYVIGKVRQDFRDALIKVYALGFESD